MPLLVLNFSPVNFQQTTGEVNGVLSRCCWTTDSINPVHSPWELEANNIWRAPGVGHTRSITSKVVNLDHGISQLLVCINCSYLSNSLGKNSSASKDTGTEIGAHGMSRRHTFILVFKDMRNQVIPPDITFEQSKTFWSWRQKIQVMPRMIIIKIFVPCLFLLVFQNGLQTVWFCLTAALQHTHTPYTWSPFWKKELQPPAIYCNRLIIIPRISVLRCLLKNLLHVISMTFGQFINLSTG